MAIQKNLRIYSRKVEEFHVFGSGETVMARKGFAIDRKRKSDATANNWSKACPWLAPQLDRLAILFDEDAELYEDVPNDPIEIRLLYLELRMQGGRAYKVVTRTGYCYDLREDPLVDALVNCGGIGQGGWFRAKFVWAGSSLIPVGGSIYKSHIDSTERKKTAKIPNKDLVPGTIYETDSTAQLLFLGWVHSARGVNCKKGLWASWTAENHSYDRTTNERKITFRVPAEEVPNTAQYITAEEYYNHGIGQPEVKGSCRVIKKIAGPFKFNGDPIAATRHKGVDRLIASYTSYATPNQYGWRRGHLQVEPTLSRAEWWDHALAKTGRSYSAYGDGAVMATITDRTQPIVYDPRLAPFLGTSAS